MKRWFLVAASVVLVAVVLSGVFIVRARTTQKAAPVQAVKPSLFRTPNSAYKYHLCSESYAFVLAPANNPYGTDYTFPDPFRKANDTLITHFAGYDQGDTGATFSVKVVMNTLATYTLSISQVQGLDGISIVLPDTHNHLQRPSIPQVIISMPLVGQNLIVLDYTCPEQWVWQATGA